MADPRIEHPHSIATGSAEDVSYHLVPFPVEVGFASISCSNTAGIIRLTYTSVGGEPITLTFLPHSPIYHIQNASCVGNVVVPLGRADGKPQVAVLTFDNNRKPTIDPAGIIGVVVALSFPAANQQEKVLVKRTLEAGQATTVHVVFSPA